MKVDVYSQLENGENGWLVHRQFQIRIFRLFVIGQSKVCNPEDIAILRLLALQSAQTMLQIRNFFNL
jgi:hypothetical protein